MITVAEVKPQLDRLCHPARLWQWTRAFVVVCLLYSPQSLADGTAEAQSNTLVNEPLMPQSIVKVPVTVRVANVVTMWSG